MRNSFPHRNRIIAALPLIIFLASPFPSHTQTPVPRCNWKVQFCGPNYAPATNNINFLLRLIHSLPTTGEECPTGQVINGFNEDGTIRCSTNRGAQGPQGTKGDPGPRGLRGSQGLTGDKGDKGSRGYTGSQGATGPQGPSGSTGSGTVGPRGPRGATGPRGLRGSQGLTGDKGDKGSRGYTGSQGATGSRGAIGRSGVSPAVKEIQTRTISARVKAYRWPRKKIYCNSDEVVVGGGGRCYADGEYGDADDQYVGWVFLRRNSPDGNGWHASCDTPEPQNVLLIIYAICMKK